MITLIKYDLHRKYEARAFKLINGRNDPTTFLPLNTNTGRQIVQNNYAHKESKYLSEEQTRHVY